MQGGHVCEGVSGRTYDLKPAYKQYGIAFADREAIRLAVETRTPMGLPTLALTVAVWGVGFCWWLLAGQFGNLVSGSGSFSN